MSEDSLWRARIVSSIAATIISLACGTNYVYSAWAPQFADRLHLTSTESNLVGLAGNFGMYSTGILIGIFVDTKGPRPAVLFGSVLLALGYFPLRQAYIRGSESMIMLCIYSFFSGIGGCAAFAAAVKTSALNWPQHRGTATAFPVAAFGLSAFFFSIFSQFMFPGDTGDFLLLLACGCASMTFFPFFFLHVLPHGSSSAYSALPASDGLTRSNSNPLRRTSPHKGTRINIRADVNEIDIEAAPPVGPIQDTDETSSLLSKASSSDSRDAIEEQTSVDKDHLHRVDIRGLKMLPKTEFWFLFSLMGILTGIGLMTINNIGNDVTALWRQYDPAKSPSFIAQRQALHVSILSVCSFLGRLCSGVGSDILVKQLNASRGWCLVISALIFSLAQLSAISISNPNFLFIVSSLTGLAYGFLFGVFPSLVAEAFGVHGLSQNWGCMTLAPVFSGNIFNILYGVIFDAHSKVLETGERVCEEGLDCYRNAYLMTIAACVLGIATSLWSIHYSHSVKEKARKLEEREA